LPTKHPLGWGNGKIIEYEDGSAGYVPTQSFSQAFRVKITDVTGFSVTKSGMMLTRTFNVLGNGTLLGSAEVNHGTSEKIEAWFRSHPLFGKQQAAMPMTRATPPVSVADEIKKLGELRSQGLLTDEEFAAQKARLLGGA
jgi:Short C-terminal domain